MKLAQKTAASVALPPDKTDHFAWDDDVPGFAIRLRRGRKGQVRRNWIFQYSVGALTRRITLGNAAAVSAAQARKSAEELYAKVRLGGDPSAEKRETRERAAETFGAVLETYLTQKRGALRPRSYVEVKRHLIKDARVLHPLPLRTDPFVITTRLLPIFAKRGDASHTQLRSTLSAFFAWLMRQGLLDRNPVLGIERRVTTSRDRVLTKDELRAVLAATTGDDTFSHIIRLLLYTGARANEIGGLRWSEIQGDRIVIPGERTKNRRPLVLPITPEIRRILDARRRRPGRDLLFGRVADRPFSGWHQSKQRLDDRIRVNGATVDAWRVHDLRRSAATFMAELGTPPHIIESILNHRGGTRGGIAAIYNRAEYETPIRNALTTWDAFLTALAEGRDPDTGKVIALRA